MAGEVMIVLCTFPDEATARQIGALLVEKQVAACINVLPGVASIYRWEGRVAQETEVLGVIKTSREAYPRLEATILDAHPYETPEVLAIAADRGAAAYVDWVTAATLPGR